MKNKINAILVILLLQLTVLTAQEKPLIAVKQESFITYKLVHPLHEIESTSKDAYCKIYVDTEKKEIKNVYVQVDVTTFNSGNSSRDSHAMEVIDALTYPDSKFQSESITQNGDSLKVAGKLTFHGITKDIVIPIKATWTSDKLTVEGQFDISLTAFKVERPSLLMIPVKDDLKFTLKQVFNLK